MKIELATKKAPLFKNAEEQNSADIQTRILPNNIKTRAFQNSQKIMSAFVDYPIKGLKGDINTNFYEFLTMGTVPYLLGSAMFMLVFNALNIGKHLNPRDSKYSSAIGKKMALGIILYGVLKNLSKNLVTKPVKIATGVDIELPYENKVVNLPKNADESANIDIVLQQRKVFDSREFFRKDLLQKSYYENIAKKLGLGDDLNDPVSETTPIIQNIISTATTGKNITSYTWAAVGVCLAAQNSWLDFFDAISNKQQYIKNQNGNFFTKIGKKVANVGKYSLNIIKTFCISGIKSFKELWQGKEYNEGLKKHYGKFILTFASALTIGLTANVICNAKNIAKKQNEKTIDKNKQIITI